MINGFIRTGEKKQCAVYSGSVLANHTKVRMVYSEALTHVHHADRRRLCLAYLCVKSTASKEHTKQPRRYTDTANGV